MAQQNNQALLSYVERARKILQHEQRTHYQDQAVKPGGLELFVANWSEQTSTAWHQAGIATEGIGRFCEQLDGYRRLDPMQRATVLQEALAILNELAGDHHTTPQPIQQTAQQATPTPVQPAHVQHTTPRPITSGPIPVIHKRESTEPALRARTIHRDPDGELVPPLTLQSPVKLPDSPPPPIKNTIQLEAGMSQGHTSLTLLSADITAIPGVGPTVAAKLRKLGINTVRDMLFYFPREHRDYSKLEKIANLPFGELSTTIGMIWEVTTRRTGKGSLIVTAEIADETGKLYATWFNQGYLQKQLMMAKGTTIIITGVKQRFGNKVEFPVRSHEFPEQNDMVNTGRIIPSYALTEGLHAKALRKFTKWVVDRYAAMLPDHLPLWIRQEGELMTLPAAVANIHYPENEDHLVSARRRLAFDELFMLQMGMQERRSRWQREAPKGTAFRIDTSRIFIEESEQPPLSVSEQAATLGTTLWSVIATDKPFEATLPFLFTNAQRRVIYEIFGDMAKNKPMCRLLQGDVGAGKTAVAAAALFMAALNGYQGAIMAPTELLAEQHARSIGKMLEPFGIRTVLLTGSQRPRERALNQALLRSGEATIAVGTHALIQDDVVFHKLGMVIIDEQHRFGVEQRDLLRQKGEHPHLLVMTATPIPRTLALTLYGDLDVSVIDQLPPGRQKIITRWRTGTKRGESYKVIKQEIESGYQAFIICPLVEESETIVAKAATTEYERLKREVFPRQRLGLIHGAMKGADKDQIMRSFRDKELDILVATSVIEVGIDIPNATVMVIEDADRFGLSQLHQFRGRVGRGKAQSYCYVLSADASIQAQERLGVFEQTEDGFRLSEEDLRLRGPGDFFGVRQSGVPELRIADLSDTQLIEFARKLAAKLWEADPYLRKPEHAPLRERLHLFWQSFVAN